MFERLNEQEISVLRKLAKESKQDSWFAIDSDGDIIDTTSDNDKIVLGEGLFLLIEDIPEGTFDKLSSEDKSILCLIEYKLIRDYLTI